MRTQAEMVAFRLRWNTKLALALVLFTAAIILIWLIIGYKDGYLTNLERSSWAKLAAVFVIMAGYCMVQWRAAKKAYLSGKSERDAMRARP